MSNTLPPSYGGMRNNAYGLFGSVTVEPITNRKVFDGISFGAAKRVVIPSSSTSGGIVNIVFDPTAVTTERLVLLPFSIKSFGAGPIYVDVYFGGTYGTDGTLVSCYNRDNESSATCNAELRVNPTITAVGTKLAPEFVVHSNGTAAVATLGGEVQDDFITLLRKDGKYLIRLTNQENVAADGWFGLNWFEVDYA